MKPCSQNRKLIAELALNSISALGEERLRDHFKSCDGCRAYFEEMSRLTNVLSVHGVRTDITASEVFHKKVLSRLERSPGQAVFTLLLNWRLIGPAVAVLALIAACVMLWPRQTQMPEMVKHVSPAHSTVRADLDPTVANYQRIVNESPDTLDELISKQGSKHAAPTPIYTVSALLRGSALD